MHKYTACWHQKNRKIF